MNINDLLATLTTQLSQSSRGLDTQAAAAKETTAGIRAGADASQAALQQAISASTQAAGAAAEIARQRAAVGESAQRIGLLDPEDVNNEYVRTMAKLTSTASEREAEFAKYRQLTETSFLDSPIAYIYNQLQLPTVVQRHNNLADQETALTTALSTRTQLVAQNKSTVTANIADATKEQAMLEAAAAEAVARSKVAQLQMENLGKISSAQMNEQALVDKKLHNTSTLFGAQMQFAQFRAMEAERAAARQERQERRALMQKDAATKAAQDSALAAGLARVSGVLGYPTPVSLEDFERMPAGDAKKKLYSAAIDGMYGDNLADAISFIASGNLPKMQQNDPAFIQGVRAISAGTKSFTAAAARKPENAKLTPAEQAKSGAAEYVLAVTQSAHDPKASLPLNSAQWDTVFNPNRSKDLTMLALIQDNKLPELKNNQYVKVLATVASTLPENTPEFRGEDESNAIKAYAELVRTRKLPIQVAAADLVAYKRAAAAYNQRTMKLASLTFPVQESAYVRVGSLHPLSSDVVGDTMSIAGAENLLLNLAVSRARAVSRFPGLGGTADILKKELLDISTPN